MGNDVVSVKRNSSTVRSKPSLALVFLARSFFNAREYSLPASVDATLPFMENLIADIELDTLNTAFLTGVKKIRSDVIEAIKSVDRAIFVKPVDQSRAYEDHPLDIGYGQTISQPFVVALITHLIEPQAHDRVLEVGSGSGYQVAILAKLCEHVYGVERVEELVTASVSHLAACEINNATIHAGDGNLGLPEQAPFHKIIVSAAAKKMPQHLLEQLQINGIMVFPLHTSLYDQMLVRIRKTSATEFKMNDILPVRFVPLVNS